MCLSVRLTVHQMKSQSNGLLSLYRWKFRHNGGWKKPGNVLLAKDEVHPDIINHFLLHLGPCNKTHTGSHAKIFVPATRTTLISAWNLHCSLLSSDCSHSLTCTKGFTATHYQLSKCKCQPSPTWLGFHDCTFLLWMLNLKSMQQSQRLSDEQLFVDFPSYSSSLRAPVSMNDFWELPVA